MDTRFIRPMDYKLPHGPLTEFVRANGLDEKDIAADFPLIIESGEMTVTEFEFEPTPDGGRRIALRDGADEIVKHTRTVPLKSPPEAHGL